MRRRLGSLVWEKNGHVLMDGFAAAIRLGDLAGARFIATAIPCVPGVSKDTVVEVRFALRAMKRILAFSGGVATTQ